MSPEVWLPIMAAFVWGLVLGIVGGVVLSTVEHGE